MSSLSTAGDTLPVPARAERLLVNRQHSSNRHMVEDLVVTSSLSSVEDLVGTSSLSSVEDTQAALARAERRWPSLLLRQGSIRGGRS